MTTIDLPLGAKLCPGKSALGTLGPLTWRSFRLVDKFGFVVDHATRGRVLTSTADLDNAPQAERTAAAWCASWKAPVDEPEQAAAEQLVGEPAPTYAIVSGADFDLALGDALAEPPAPSPEPAPVVTFAEMLASIASPVCGWRIELSGEPGACRAAMFNAATGEAGMVFPLRATPQDAIHAAARWAMLNPCDVENAAEVADRRQAAVAGLRASQAEPVADLWDTDPADAAVGECTHEFEGAVCRFCGSEPVARSVSDDVDRYPDALPGWASLDETEAGDINGWAFSVHPRDADVQVILTDNEDGCDKQAFVGKTEADALGQARTWARENPTPTERRRLAGEAAHAAADEYFALGEELAALKARTKSIKRRRQALADRLAAVTLNR